MYVTVTEISASEGAPTASSLATLTFGAMWMGRLETELVAKLAVTVTMILCARPFTTGAELSVEDSSSLPYFGGQPEWQQVREGYTPTWRAKRRIWRIPTHKSTPPCDKLASIYTLFLD